MLQCTVQYDIAMATNIKKKTRLCLGEMKRVHFSYLRFAKRVSRKK